MELRKAWANAVHLLEHTATVGVGIALIVLGLALTFSIVFVLPGIIVLAVGICIVVGGVFSHTTAGP